MESRKQNAVRSMSGAGVRQVAGHVSVQRTEWTQEHVSPGGHAGMAAVVRQFLFADWIPNNLLSLPFNFLLWPHWNSVWQRCRKTSNRGPNVIDEVTSSRDEVMQKKNESSLPWSNPILLANIHTVVEMNTSQYTETRRERKREESHWKIDWAPLLYLLLSLKDIPARLLCGPPRWHSSYSESTSPQPRHTDRQRTNTG